MDMVKADRRTVVLDIMMPGTDGLTLCHMIKQDAAVRDTKIIMVSASRLKPKAARDALRANLFIEKPYNIDTLFPTGGRVVGPPRAGPRSPVETALRPSLGLLLFRRPDLRLGGDAKTSF